MSSDARLILKQNAAPDRWELSERADYDLDRFDREFQDRLYSEKGREILRQRGMKGASSATRPAAERT